MPPDPYGHRPHVLVSERSSRPPRKRGHHVALGVPLIAGVLITATAGDPFTMPAVATRIFGTMLIAVFAVRNGAALWIMARERTALLPGGATRVILDRGPFGLSRNPLYLGLITSKCRARIAVAVGVGAAVRATWSRRSAPGRHPAAGQSSARGVAQDDPSERVIGPG